MRYKVSRQQTHFVHFITGYNTLGIMDVRLSCILTMPLLFYRRRSCARVRVRACVCMLVRVVHPGHMAVGVRMIYFIYLL